MLNATANVERTRPTLMNAPHPGSGAIPDRSAFPKAGDHCDNCARFPDRVRRWLRQPLLCFFVYLWTPVRNRLLRLTGRCRATVLLYHRVSDERRDPITVGAGQFLRQLEILRRRYDVVDLRTFLAGRGKPRRRPVVVVTFDDGYADNYDAAVSLRRAGLPATFFVATNVITRHGSFAHDLKRHGRGIAPLSWDQLREMVDWGFLIGNHTADHTDLGSLPLHLALDEIRRAEEQLDRELGSRGRVPCLAYPFGLPEHMTVELRSALALCGVEYCLSAHGGVNRVAFDPADIRRQAIDHSFSDVAFRAAVEGWRFRSR